ncbi:MAG: patatin-like phospholipase family protein [Gammaproteobacteria bacterium]
MRDGVLIVLLIGLSTFASAATHAAPCDNNSGRPSVGLALSGGGARGAAHVGVLKVLEALRIPVDCIAGTSMGAIVGGLYAGGHDAAELEAIIGGVDWKDAFRDDPSRAQLSFRRKQDDYDFLADFELGLRGGSVQLPLGVVQGQKLQLLLRRLNTRVRDVDDFDELPTPFRAVATDAVTGDSVVLGRGELTIAQRASMAAPGVFAPVEMDDKMLIDGGISNNLPINVVRAMGADIVIAVDISFPLLERDALNSAIALSNQALTILVRREAARQLSSLSPRDIAIIPELGTFSSADFSNLQLAIEKGVEAADAQTQALQRLSADAESYRYYTATRSANRQQIAPIVRSISLQDDSRLSRLTLANLLQTEVGKPFDGELLEQDIARLYGLNIFEVVDYQVSGDNAVDIRISTRQKSWGPNFLNFGLSLVDDFDRASRYALGVRYTRTQVNPLGGEWRLDLQLGNDPRLTTEFYQPLSYTSPFFIAPRLVVREFESDLFADTGELLAQYRVSDKRIGLDVGYAINERSELRVGVTYGSGSAKLIIGDPELGSFNADAGRARMLYRYDSLDNTAFPTDGVRAAVNVEALREEFGTDRNRERASVEWLGVHSRGDTSYLLGLNAFSNVAGDGGIEDLFELGGLFNLSGYRTGQLRGQHSATAVLSAYRKIALGQRLQLPVYFGASVEAGNVWDQSSDVGFDNLRYGGSAFLGIDTPLGPAYLGYGFAEGGNTAAYFFLGQRFGSSIQ